MFAFSSEELEQHEDFFVDLAFNLLSDYKVFNAFWLMKHFVNLSCG